MFNFLIFDVCLFVFWASQPLGIISWLKTNLNPSLCYSAHKSFNTNHSISVAQVNIFYTLHLNFFFFYVFQSSLKCLMLIWYLNHRMLQQLTVKMMLPEVMSIHIELLSQKLMKEDLLTELGQLGLVLYTFRCCLCEPLTRKRSAVHVLRQTD